MIDFPLWKLAIRLLAILVLPALAFTACQKSDYKVKDIIGTYEIADCVRTYQDEVHFQTYEIEIKRSPYLSGKVTVSGYANIQNRLTNKPLEVKGKMKDGELHVRGQRIVGNDEGDDYRIGGSRIRFSNDSIFFSYSMTLLLGDPHGGRCVGRKL